MRNLSFQACLSAILIFLFAPFLKSAPIRVRACRTLDRPGAAYVLLNDVMANGTCFSVQAEHITLDLNGHEILYATDSTAPGYGILGVACWDPELYGNPCGGRFDYFTVKNGKIVQARTAPPRSHAIRLGQGWGRGLTASGLDIAVYSPSSIPIFGEWAGGGWHVYGNTIHNYVTEITNRHQLEGMSIKPQDDRQGGLPNMIHDNKVFGGAQGGIYIVAPGSKVYNNEIHLDGRFTNDFCIYAWADGAEVYGNTCDNTVNNGAGRGIHVDSARGVKVHDNTVVAIEQPRVLEYGGCELGGAYAIQLEQTARSAEVYHNRFLALADQCQASALRITDEGPGANNLVHDNVFVARRVGAATALANGASFSGVQAGNGDTIARNIFTADSVGAYIPWDGGAGLTFSDDTFAVGSNPSGWVLVRFDNHFDSSGNEFQDSVFQNGANAELFFMRPIGTPDWVGPAGYTVRWTYGLTVVDPNNHPLPGAVVTITDSLGQQVFSGTTNAQGQISTLLAQFRRFNRVEGVAKEEHTPHMVAVSLSGYAPQSVRLTADAQKKMTLALPQH